METSAKINEGVEEAFFTLARCADARISRTSTLLISLIRDIKTRLIDSQADAAGSATGAPTDGSVRVNQPATNQNSPICCS